MGSAAFLILDAAVSFGHVRIHRETGANPTLIWASVITLLIMFVLIMLYVLGNQPAAAVVLVVILAVSTVIEWTYHRWTGRRLQRLAEATHDDALSASPTG